MWVGVDAGSALWLWGGGMLGGWWVGSGSVEVWGVTLRRLRVLGGWWLGCCCARPVRRWAVR